VLQILIYRSVSYNAFVGAGFFPPETQLVENVPNSGKIRPSRSNFTDGREESRPYTYYTNGTINWNLCHCTAAEAMGQ